MDVLDRIGLGDRQHVDQVPQILGMVGKAAAAEIGLVEFELVDHRAHGPIKDQDSLGQQLFQSFTSYRRSFNNRHILRFTRDSLVDATWQINSSYGGGIRQLTCDSWQHASISHAPRPGNRRIARLLSVVSILPAGESRRPWAIAQGRYNPNPIMRTALRSALGVPTCAGSDFRADCLANQERFARWVTGHTSSDPNIAARLRRPLLPTRWAMSNEELAS